MTRCRYATVLLLAIAFAHPVMAQQEGGSALRRGELAARLHVLSGPADPNDPNPTTIRLPDEIERFLQDPFDLSRPTPSLAVLERLAGPHRETAGARGHSDLPELESLDVVNALAGNAPAILLGVTDFFVERAQDEVAFAFVLRLREPARTAFARNALPRSAGLVASIDGASFQALLPMVQAALVSDLTSLPVRLREDSVRRALGISADVAQRVEAVGLLYAKGNELRSGRPPLAVLSSLIDVDSADLSRDDLRRGLNLVGAIAREYAGSGEALVALGRPEHALKRRYFTAFLARDLVGLLELQGPAATDFLRIVGSREADVSALVTQLHTLETELRRMHAQRDSLAADFDAERYLVTVAHTLQTVAAARAFVSRNSSVAFDRWIADATELVVATSRRDYGQAVTWLLSMRGRQPTNAQLQLLSFGVALANASTPEEASRALRSVSAPVGSYRAKRNQEGEWWEPRTVSVVGYLGLGGGWENEDGLAGFGDAGQLGPALPIGIEASMGTAFGAMSVFVSLIDVGNLASIRLSDTDTVRATPETGWRQVLAPGAFLVLNLSRSVPLSLGAGIQVAPGLRESTTDGGSDLTVSRLHLFAGIDATLFQFRF